jgi:hypothetical protein
MIPIFALLERSVDTSGVLGVVEADEIAEHLMSLKI